MLQKMAPLLSLSLLVSSSSPTATALTEAMSESVHFSSALTSAKWFLLIWRKNWRRRDFNPQPSDLIQNELDHRTMVSCLRLIVLYYFGPNTFLCSCKGISLWVISFCSFGALFMYWDKHKSALPMHRFPTQTHKKTV